MTHAALAAVLADEARRLGLSLIDVAAEVALLATPEEVPEPGVQWPLRGFHHAVSRRQKLHVSTTASTPAEAALVVAVGAAILRRGER
jgi:hypothetical protein